MGACLGVSAAEAGGMGESSVMVTATGRGVRDNSPGKGGPHRAGAKLALWRMYYGVQKNLKRHELCTRQPGAEGK